jgi:pilus assembly protein CpaE
MLTAAIVSDKNETSGALQATLQQTGFVSSVQRWMPSPESQPSPGESVPDVVLMNLSHDAQAYFALAAHLRRLRPDVHILACSRVEKPSPDILLQAMRCGIEDFLPLSIGPAALKETLARLVSQSGSAPADESKKLIVVLGAKGGVGTTTVAVNLGVQLAHLTPERVTLMDLARPLGHISLLLDLKPRFSVRDSVENLERLDTNFFGGLLTRHESGLWVLTGTSDSDEWQYLSMPSLDRVVNVARSSSKFVVADLGSLCWSDWGPVLRQASAMILVAEADVPALWALERHVFKMASLGINPARLGIVINRWHRRDDEVVKDLEAKTKCSILARFPNDFRQVSQAINSGVPLCKNHRDPLGAEFRQLACRLTGFAAPAEQKGSILKLFSQERSDRDMVPANT